MSDKEESTSSYFMTFKQFGTGKDFDIFQNNEYRAMISPDSFERSYAFHYDDPDPEPTGGSEGKLVRTDPESYSFTLVIDGTGVLGENLASVEEQLNQLSSVLFTYDDYGRHHPNHVRLHYCDRDFDCTVTSFKISYTLFNFDGNPLRAKVSCGLASLSAKKPPRKAKKDDKKKNDPPQGVVCICSNQSPQEAMDIAMSNGQSSMYSPYSFER